MKDKIRIYLCDLFHNYLGAATSMFPLNIGYVAAWANKAFPDDVDIRLFKYPDDFIKQFRNNTPHIVGFGNYAWNDDLNNKISKWVKSISPETVVVFGGHNICYSDKGHKEFFNTHNSVDFFILYEGEIPFEYILKEIFNRGLSLSSLKSESIDGVIFYDGNKVVRGNDVPRIKNINAIPSPYLTGLLDRFFDTNLIPIVETNRGCPYRCTYCCQGAYSRNKVEFFGLERVKKEIRYIADRVKNANILNLADPNFGIAKRDIEIAKYISKLLEETGYPRRVSMNWAKNQPRLFEIAKILNNAFLINSLQTLDETVLNNIKRKNIKISIFKDITNKVNHEGGISGTEIILGLPGETKESHMETIRTLFDWNVSFIICYTCYLLKCSELFILRENGKFKCKTKFRLMDNAFGKYNGITSFGIEEGVRSTSTMSKEEILYFRPVHWLIQFLWNYKFYYDLLKYIQSLGINPLDYIIRLIDNADKAPENVRRIFQEFKDEAKAEWFDSPDQLEEYYIKHFDSLAKGNFGKMNGKYIFKVLLEAREDFETYLYDIAVSILSSREQVFEEMLNYLSVAIIDLSKEEDEVFKEKNLSCKYNFLEWKESMYQKNLNELYHPDSKKFIFYLPLDQKQSLKTLLKQYKHENKNVTLRKMSEYMDIRDFFYRVKLV